MFILSHLSIDCHLKSAKQVLDHKTISGMRNKMPSTKKPIAWSHVTIVGSLYKYLTLSLIA